MYETHDGCLSRNIFIVQWGRHSSVGFYRDISIAIFFRRKTNLARTCSQRRSHIRFRNWGKTVLQLVTIEVCTVHSVASNLAILACLSPTVPNVFFPLGKCGRFNGNKRKGKERKKKKKKSERERRERTHH